MFVRRCHSDHLVTMAGSPANSRKARKQNFTTSKISVLTEKVEEDRSVLQSKLTNSVTNQQKNEIWAEIVDVVNAVGAKKRTTAEVCEKWKNLHSQVSMHGFELCFSEDLWQECFPSYNWSQKSPTILCRLDFWLISNNLCDFVNSTDIIPAIRTDHAAISLILGEIGEAKGPGMWKMNASLLDDEEYLNYLSVNISKWKLEGEKELSDKCSVWDWIKSNIRKHARSTLKKKLNREMV